MSRSEKKVNVILLTTFLVLVVNKILNYRRYSEIIYYITDIEKIKHTLKFNDKNNSNEYLLYLYDIQSSAYQVSEKADICRLRAIKPLYKLGMNKRTILFVLTKHIFKESTNNINTKEQVNLFINLVESLSTKDYLLYLLGMKTLNLNNKNINKKNKIHIIPERKYITLK